jgi:hypothetical protein
VIGDWRGTRAAGPGSGRGEGAFLDNAGDEDDAAADTGVGIMAAARGGREGRRSGGGRGGRATGSRCSGMVGRCCGGSLMGTGGDGAWVLVGGGGRDPSLEARGGCGSRSEGAEVGRTGVGRWVPCGDAAVSVGTSVGGLAAEERLEGGRTDVGGSCGPSITPVRGATGGPRGSAASGAVARREECRVGGAEGLRRAGPGGVGARDW